METPAAVPMLAEVKMAFPETDFGLDVGFVSTSMLGGELSQLPHADLTHFMIWARCLGMNEHYVESHKDEIKEKTDTLFYGNPFFAIYMAMGGAPSIEEAVYQNQLHPVMNTLARVKQAADDYVNAHGGDAKKILATEHRARLASGNIVRDDVTEDTLDEVSQPEAVRRVQWILANLEEVKDVFTEDYQYWQGIANMLASASV